MTDLAFEESGDAPEMDNEELFRLTWEEFNHVHPDESACVEALVDYFNGALLYACRKCSGQKIMRAYGQRVGRCLECQAEVHVTAGSLFNRARKIRPWVAAIWLAERGFCVSSARLHRLVGVAQSTAWGILKKVGMVLGHYLDVACDAIKLNLGMFCAAFSKRSLATPAHQHPVAEQAELEANWREEQDQQGSSATRDSATNDQATDSEFATKDEPVGDLGDVYSCVSNTPAHFDFLFQSTGLCPGVLGARLTMLELDGWIERLPGDQYVRRSAPSSSGKPGKMPENGNSSGGHMDDETDILDFLSRTFRGISRKYVQLYLASYWCVKDRKRWDAGSLFSACCRFPEVRSSQIRAYESPLFGKVITPQQAA